MLNFAQVSTFATGLSHDTAVLGNTLIFNNNGKTEDLSQIHTIKLMEKLKLSKLCSYKGRQPNSLSKSKTRTGYPVL